MTTVSSGGFCFPCGVAAGQDSTSNTVEYNPFPFLRLGEGQYLRSHPLVRACYSPMTLDELPAILARRRSAPPSASASKQDRADFRQWFIFMHELAHLWYLDWTPAKELAKLYLSYAYDCLDVYISSLLRISWSARKVRAQAARMLDLWNAQLSTIEQTIGRTEELIATAVPALVLEKHTEEGGLWGGLADDLDALVKDCLAAQENAFPGFREDFEKILPLVRLMMGDAGLRVYIAPLLQPVRMNDPPSNPHAVDATNQLETLATLIRAGEAKRELEPQLRDLRDDMLGEWFVLLGLLIESLREPAMSDIDRRFGYRGMGRLLWQITRGELQPASPEMLVEQAGETLKNMQLTAIESGRLGPESLLVASPESGKHARTLVLHEARLTSADCPLRCVVPISRCFSSRDCDNSSWQGKASCVRTCHRPGSANARMRLGEPCGFLQIAPDASSSDRGSGMTCRAGAE